MVEEVRHLTTKPLVKAALSTYFQCSTKMNPEPFFTISKSLKNHVFNHADKNVQTIGPVKEVKSLWICG